ncbi:MAG: toxin HicA, partial [Candidatus Nephrothrix sp. EaCA]
SELVRLLKQHKWFVVRQKGSHMIMEHKTKAGQLLVCPSHSSQTVGKPLEMNIKKQAGIK